MPLCVVYVFPPLENHLDGYSRSNNYLKWIKKQKTTQDYYFLANLDEKGKFLILNNNYTEFNIRDRN